MFVKSVASAVALVVSAIAPSVAPGQDTTTDVSTTRPNVIMIFCDDMGYGDISSFTDEPQKVTTPNIDRLADEGMKFTQFYVNSPVCSPSRASVISGMFASETGLTNFLHTRQHNRENDQQDYLDPKLAYLPKAFHAAGYATGHFGKWHLGGGRDVDNAPSIKEYGYDEYSSTFESPDPDPKLGKFPPWENRTEPEQVPDYDRTRYQNARALDFLKRHNDKPCFVTLWHNDLHATYHPTPEMAKKHGGVSKPTKSYENFLGILEDYDREIGKFLDELEKLGLAENTIVFFTGDNGSGTHPEKRGAGLRGAKLTLYEGGIREPFIIRWPGKIPAGSENNATVLSSVDLLPTLTSMAGIELSTEASGKCDGEDLSHTMLKPQAARSMERTTPLYWENGTTRPPGSPRGPSLAIRKGDWKLLVNHDGSDMELYDIAKDPRETTNVTDQNTSVAEELKREIIAWSKTLPSRTHP